MSTKEPRGKIVRRLGVNIFGNPKFDKLLKKKPHGPGQSPESNRRPAKQSVYGKQLTEKQKIRFCYGVTERQLKGIYLRGRKMAGVAGANMLILLERRIDNVVYRLGLASTRAQARQFVRHGHFTLNGRKVDMPGIAVNTGDVISVSEKSRKLLILQENAETAAAAHNLPDWLSVDGMSGKILRLPVRADIPHMADEQMVVEFYAR